MKNIIKPRAKRIFRQFGIDISWVNHETYNPKMYLDVLRGAVSVQNPFNIIQVGANDGKHNDPLYDFVKEYKEVTNIILIEPIESVIPHLKKNYSYHPSSKIVNKAIGIQESSSITLYGVKENYWDEINVGYGEDWPSYRIPTGVITTNKIQMLEWISENVQSDATPEDIIQVYNVQAVQPDSIIDKSQIINEVHLLQVDAEGMDDEIVYSFLESGVEPDIINIETNHLDQEKIENYDQKMKSEGYDVYDYSRGERLAIR